YADHRDLPSSPPRRSSDLDFSRYLPTDVSPLRVFGFTTAGARVRVPGRSAPRLAGDDIYTE
ncbi:hypothetical protein, partial [Mycobacterium sp. NAZ190054]|uniref:hypothetical protein n=1 Tax=Mycobacterium sp. NAZ190054 TaxID=1747766 RepID=UPI000A4F12B5